MKHTKNLSLRARTLVMLIMVAIGVNVAIIGYGVVWTWLRSTGLKEQNLVSIKPQEAPGAGSVVASIVPITGSGLRLSTKNESRRLINPIKTSADSLLRGEQGFLINCSPCHGVNGQGIMGAVPRLFPTPPDEVEAQKRYLSGYLGYSPDIDASFALSMTDGELYWTITNGGDSIMPGYADALSPEARWDVVNYIKSGLGDQNEE